MVERVNSDEIEGIVGTYRRIYAHIGYADSETQTFYIMHSKICLETCPDLRECDYSLALDNGRINVTAEDEPKYIMLEEGGIVMIDLFGEK